MQFKINCAQQTVFEVDVDVQEFMRANFPRKHGWQDAAEAMAYLRKQKDSKWLHDTLAEMAVETEPVWGTTEVLFKT